MGLEGAAGAALTSYAVNQSMKGVTSLISRVASNHRMDRQLKQFYRPFASGPSSVVIASEDVDSTLRGTQIYDILGAVEILEVFQGFRRKDALWGRAGTLAVMRADKLAPGDRRRYHLISIGSGVPNLVTRDIHIAYNTRMSYMVSPQRKRYIEDLHGGSHTYWPEVKKNKRGKIEGVHRDYGLITRVANPWGDGAEAIVFAGCYGWGTQAAIRVGLSPRYVEEFNKHAKACGKHFQVVCECEVGDDGSILRERPLIETWISVPQKPNGTP